MSTPTTEQFYVLEDAIAAFFLLGRYFLPLSQSLFIISIGQSLRKGESIRSLTRKNNRRR
ncbi:hypothetical protein ACN9MY_05645 [Pseudoduganella sp. R-31]|uniref:hypothetical protein n=1 Tax=Pseudoduganella sp. R-31 TaxID=3404060 RepID=UPI003CEDD9F4